MVIRSDSDHMNNLINYDHVTALNTKLDNADLILQQPHITNYTKSVGQWRASLSLAYENSFS